MPTIDVEIGLTVALGNSEYEFIKPLVSIRDVDIEGDVEAQIGKAIKVACQVWDGVSQVMEVKLSEAFGEESDGTISATLTEQLKQIAQVLVQHDKQLKFLGEHIKKLDAGDYASI